jgi:hypothetical protein
MTKAHPRPGGTGTGAVTAGSGQASRPTGPVTPARGAVADRVVPAVASAVAAPAGRRRHYQLESGTVHERTILAP